jgi:ribosomal protein L16 Arg81 hydroxylase
MKLDVNKIPNFETLSDETKKILSELDLDVSTPDYSGYVKKDVFDKKAAEAAELSKQLKAKMTEAEQAEAEKTKIFDDMKVELETLRKEKTISAYKAEYLALGYADELATETATAMAEGNTQKVFANHKNFNETQKKNIEAAALNKQPDLSVGKPPENKTKEQIEIENLRKGFGLQ